MKFLKEEGMNGCNKKNVILCTLHCRSFLILVVVMIAVIHRRIGSG